MTFVKVLNDYLVIAIPNMHQMSRSNLVHVKKNKAMQWFHKLPHDQQSCIIQLAIRKRAEVRKEIKEKNDVKSISPKSYDRKRKNIQITFDYII